MTFHEVRNTDISAFYCIYLGSKPTGLFIMIIIRKRDEIVFEHFLREKYKVEYNGKKNYIASINPY